MTKEHLRCQKLRKALTIGKHAYHLRAPNKIRLQGAVQDTQCWGSRSHPSVGVWTSTYSSHPLLTNCLWPWAGSSCLSVKTKKYHKLNQQWLLFLLILPRLPTLPSLLITYITNNLPMSPSQFHSTIKGHTASTSVVSSLADPKHCQAGKTFKEQNCPDYDQAF